VWEDAVRLRRAELEDQTASLWRVLADPTRRRILDLLRDRPRTTGEIASHFAISRIAVMRHLEVLCGEGLVVSRKRGRQRWHYLNAVPLQRLHERWVDPIASGFAAGLLRLKDNVEVKGRPMESTRSPVDMALEMVIAATPAAVFSALTKDVSGWWGHPFVSSRATGLALEPRLGGLFVEQWDNGGEVIASVTGWAQDQYLKLAGPFHMGAASGVAVFDLAESAQGTVVRFSFQAFGAVDAAIAELWSRGWTELVGSRLKDLVETGTRLGIAPDTRPDIRSISWE